MNVCNVKNPDISPAREPGYSFHTKCPEPLNQGYYDHLDKGYVCAGQEDKYIRGCKRFFEEDLLPITDPHIGPGGRYYLPPSLIRDYRAIFEIIERRERGFVRLLEVLKRYQEKLRQLEIINSK